MKNNIRTYILCALLVGSLALCGCGLRSQKPSGADIINPAQRPASVLYHAKAHFKPSSNADMNVANCADGIHVQLPSTFFLMAPPDLRL